MLITHRNHLKLLANVRSWSSKHQQTILNFIRIYFGKFVTEIFPKNLFIVGLKTPVCSVSFLHFPSCVFGKQQKRILQQKNLRFYPSPTELRIVVASFWSLSALTIDVRKGIDCFHSRRSFLNRLTLGQSSNIAAAAGDVWIISHTL